MLSRAAARRRWCTRISRKRSRSKLTGSLSKVAASFSVSCETQSCETQSDIRAAKRPRVDADVSSAGEKDEELVRLHQKNSELHKENSKLQKENSELLALLEGQAELHSREVERREASVAFMLMLYTNEPDLWKDALDFGTKAAEKGLLDLKDYRTCDPLLALANTNQTFHNRWTNAKERDQTVVGLVDLVLKIKAEDAKGSFSVQSQQETNYLIESCKSDNQFVAEILAARSDTDDINYRGSLFGRTALMWALSRGHTRVCDKLLSRVPEIELDITDSDGKTVEYYATIGCMTGVDKAIMRTRIEAAREATSIYRSNAAALTFPILLNSMPKELVLLIFSNLLFPVPLHHI
jgi:hypothetical protein